MNNRLLTETVRMMLCDAGVETKCTHDDVWHKVYKDVLFNETMFYYDREIFAVSLPKEPYIQVSLLDNTVNTYVVFRLNTKITYPRDENELKKSIKNLSKNYKKCVDAYNTMKEEIDRANATIIEMSKKADNESLIHYESQIERELNCLLQNLMKIL